MRGKHLRWNDLLSGYYDLKPPAVNENIEIVWRISLSKGALPPVMYFAGENRCQRHIITAATKLVKCHAGPDAASDKSVLDSAFAGKTGCHILLAEL
jgi:hypothetical protein